MASWNHTDRRGLQRAFLEASKRAEALDWTSGSLAARVSDLRALVLASVYLGARLAGVQPVTRIVGEKTVVSLDVRGELAFADTAHRDAFVTLGKTWKLVAQPVKAGKPPPENLVTIEGERAPSDAGFLPVLVAFAVGMAAGTAFAFVVDYASNIIDRELGRWSDERKLLATHAQVLALVDRHVAREEKAGKSLPLDAATAAALGQLGEAQTRLTQPGAPPGKAPGGSSDWIPLLAAAALAAAYFS